MNTKRPTPPELVPFEPAARVYCHDVGADPDQVVRKKHQLIVGMVVEQPLWHEAAERLLDLSRMLSAMKRARETMQ